MAKQHMRPSNLILKLLNLFLFGKPSNSSWHIERYTLCLPSDIHRWKELNAINITVNIFIWKNFILNCYAKNYGRLKQVWISIPFKPFLEHSKFFRFWLTRPIFSQLNLEIQTSNYSAKYWTTLIIFKAFQKNQSILL